MIKPFIRAAAGSGWVMLCSLQVPLSHHFRVGTDQADQHIAGTNHPPDKIALIAPASNISVIIILSSSDDGLREMDDGVSLFCEKVC